MRDAFRRLVSGEEGAALVEATIIAPILVAMGVYVADFGLFFKNKIEMQNAAQAGAQWAMANRIYNSSDIQLAALNATQLPAAGTSACTAASPACVTMTSTLFCGCSDPNANPPVTQLTSASGACTGTTNVVNSTCNTTGIVGNYVTVTARTPPATPYRSFVPYGLISSTYNIIQTTTVRIQ